MEPRPPLIPKKVRKMVRVVLFMTRKGVTKSKFVIDLRDLLTKRGKIVGKALNDLMLHHHCTLGCRSHDMQTSFISPGEYEFSCSNSPAYRPYVPFHVRKRKDHAAAALTYEDDVAVSDYSDAAEVSPLVVGPVRRRVRVTDFPFPLRDDDKDCHVDKEAEEFIQRFYKQLRLQKLK